MGQPRKLVRALLSFFCLMCSAAGQISVSPGSSTVVRERGPRDAATASAPPPEVEPATPAPAHAFWDRTNRWLFVGIAFTRGMDYASTRNMQARGRKEILLASEVVNNSAAFASLEAAGTLTSVGISYLFHRTGHHKLERWMSIAHIGVAAFGDVRNYCLQSRPAH
ncbi:MAG TPA: hypothetical protein VEK33_22725 [Terriglobales bacterium]|nr:hypothetical protein [Terriglobales bacterium]